MQTNRIFIGAPGTGKTYSAKYAVIQVIWEIMTAEEKESFSARFYDPDNFCEEAFNYAEKNYVPGIKLASLHEGMTTSDFIEGITIEFEGGTPRFLEKNKLVKQLVLDMEGTKKPGFLILDDVHRVNLSGVLGELLYAFAHRGERVTLPSGRTICVPDNLYVFMTMNTLHPKFSLDSAWMSSFQVTYMPNGKDILDEIVVSNFYKSAYYNIDKDVIFELNPLWRDFKDILKESIGNGEEITLNCDIELLLSGMPNPLKCFDKAFADKFIHMEFPIMWESRTALPFKYRTRYNGILDQICKKMNEINEMYSKFCSVKTLEILEAFRQEVQQEYYYYNAFLDYMTPEYDQDSDKYQIGYTYFLPSHGSSMWNASEILQNKIRSQVLPLLKQYYKEGIIIGCRLPEYEHTATFYTRNRNEIKEEKIEFNLNKAYWNIFTDLYYNKKSTTNVKNPMNTSQGYNATYGVLFEIVHDMICHPLINNWRIMDLLCRSKEIYFKTDVTGLYEGCLLALSKLSDKIVTAGTDNTPGNQSLTSYKRDLHAFYYQGQKYVLLSKIGLDNKECSKSVKACKLHTPVLSRYHNIYPIVKVLVYEYLRIYRDNLFALANENVNADEALEIQKDINQVNQDLRVVDQMRWHGADADLRRWNLLDEIYNLPT